MLTMSSFMWLFWLALSCWCCMDLTEGRTWIVVDSSSSELDSPPRNRENTKHRNLISRLMAHCMDDRKNQDETDIDCGGITCPKCNGGMTCKADCDCISDSCKNNKCAPSESCEDEVKNQDETDIDCGGIKCPKCNDTMICMADCDCISDSCKNNRCAPYESCEDEVKNQDETDIDCGGIKCPKCNDTMTCMNDCDCISSFCKNNRCAPPESCQDGIKNQDETDIDCGGMTCPKCEDMNACNQSSDCISDFCNSNHICTIKCTIECKNNGTCTANNTCNCTTGFTGETCEIQSTGLCSINDTSSLTTFFLITFDSGPNQYSDSTADDFDFSTTYTQTFTSPIHDGYFGITNSVSDSFPTWHANALDHTQGDSGGYMFLVNADYDPGQVFNHTINDLCIGSPYEFSVYLANVVAAPNNLIKPNVIFEIRDTTITHNLIATLSTGPVPEYTDITWVKYGLSFVTPVSSVVLLMISNAPGGNGNDFAVDDIQFRTCFSVGPVTCPSGSTTATVPTIINSGG